MDPVRRTSDSGDRRMGSWRVWVVRLAGLLALAAGATTASIPLGRVWWLFEVVSHFRVQALIAVAVGCAVLLAGGRPRAAVPCAALALLNLALIVPLYLPAAGDAPESGPAIRVLSFNVHGQNPEHERTLALIRALRPDVMMLLEVTPGLARALEPLASEYAFRTLRAQPGSFGIGLYSRIPVTAAEIVWLGEPAKPALRAELLPAGRPLTLIGTHTMPPKGQKGFRERNRQLADLGSLAAAEQGPLIVVGDLNLTSWSPFFSELLRTTGLRDSRKGFGVQPTWPARRPLLWIPIDHVLVSDDVVVHARRTGPPVGSDHLAVVCDVALARWR